MSRYVVTTKREHRGRAPTALALVRDMTDVVVVSSGNDDVVIIDTTPERAAELHRNIGATHWVEPEVRRGLH